MAIRRAITLRIANFFIKCLGLITSLLDQFLKLQTLWPLSLTNGTFYGAPQVVRVTYMRAWMNFKKSIISHRVTRLLGRIDYVSTLSECKKDSESRILTLSQILTSSLMNLENFMSTTKNWSSMIAKRIFGLLSPPTLPREEASCWLTTSMT